MIRQNESLMARQQGLLRELIAKASERPVVKLDFGLDDALHELTPDATPEMLTLIVLAQIMRRLDKLEGRDSA